MGARLSIVRTETARDPDREWIELRNDGDRAYAARDCTLVVKLTSGHTRRAPIRDPFVLEPGKRLRLITGKAARGAEPGRHYLFRREPLLSGPGDVVRLMHREREVCSMVVAPRSKRQWIKHRPKVSVRLSGDRQPGGRFVAEVALMAKRPVRVNGVTAELRGSQFVRVGAGKSSRSQRHEFLVLSANVVEAGELPEGTTLQRVQFSVPQDAPPSINASGLQVSYTLRVHIDIPWWPDRYALFDVPLEFPRGRAQPNPVVLISSDKGPDGQGPYAELSLASAELAAGNPVAGAVALYNVGKVRYRQVALSLQRRHRVFLGGRDGDYFQRIGYALELPAQQIEGDAIPFSLTLPSKMAPSYEARPLRDMQWSIDWSLVARVEVGWARDLRFEIPLRVVCSDEPQTEHLAAPSIGSQRLATLWANVAERQGMRHVGGHLELETDEGTLTILRQRDGQGHLLLSAELRLARPLGLGLDVHEARGLRRFGGHEVGVPHFDRRHVVRAHDAEQIASLLAPLLTDWPERYRLHGSDEALRLSLPGGGYQRRPLEALAERAKGWLHRLPALRAGVPFPKALREHAESWRELAEQLRGGELDRGAVSVSGRHAGRQISIAVLWTTSGQPEGLRLSALGQPLEDYRLNLDEHSLGLLSKLPSAARERITRIFEQAPKPTQLEVQAQGVHLLHPNDGTPGKPTLERCAALTELLPLLEGQTGPYR
jgi:hypothetical protein